MRIRVRFEKTGPVRFVGHLDFMRTFTKIIRKSGLAAVYTKGFNPHMVLSFADPLGVGQQSTGEYADIEFAYRDTAELTEQEEYRLSDIGIDNASLPEPPSCDAFLEALNAASVEGVHFTDAVRVGLIKSSKAMALVRGASWQILMKDGLDGISALYEGNALERFLEQEEIVVHKVTKKSEKDVNIRPQIFELYAAPADAFPAFAVSDEYSERRSLFLRCECGSNGNLKPQTVMEALGAWLGTAFEETSYLLVRRELYDAKGETLLSHGTRF